MNESTNSRIELLREAMRQQNIDATIIPHADPHQSEYMSTHWLVRPWLSGFTGSAGDLVVTTNEAFIWADSRYWLQAAEQLNDTCINVMEDGKPSTPTIVDYLCSHLQKGATVGVDGMLLSINATSALEKKLMSHGINLRVDFSPIDSLWLDRPTLPKDEVFVHELNYTGEEASSKIQRILKEVQDQGATSTFISSLAEIAWTLNIRGRDVECNPVVTSYMYLATDHAVLFIDSDKLTAEVRDHLTNNGVSVQPYTAITQFLSSLPNDAQVLLSAGQSAGALLPILGKRAVVGYSPVAMLQAIKNDVQLQGVRNAMIRDGVALVKSFMEIEQTLYDGKPLTELAVADILLKHRSAQPLFFDLSFGTIAGFGPHGAIVHYNATPESNATITNGNLLLVDSGANYIDGTTDITRTISIGEPSDAQRHDFTLVMKGHIALAQVVYPVGTRGAQLDALARVNLWKEGLSYLHGTGHGVGHFLNVHEGPQSIRLNDTLAPMTPGMITSNEPGLYREGEYGIRCENLVLTTPAFSTDFGDFLKFETLTLFPFDVRLFDTTIMTDSEIEWVNTYHSTVCQRLLPHLDAKEQEWLISKTPLLTR